MQYCILTVFTVCILYALLYSLYVELYSLYAILYSQYAVLYCPAKSRPPTRGSAADGSWYIALVTVVWIMDGFGLVNGLLMSALLCFQLVCKVGPHSPT